MKKSVQEDRVHVDLKEVGRIKQEDNQIQSKIISNDIAGAKLITFLVSNDIAINLNEDTARYLLDNSKQFSTGNDK
ncbi:hypothetical protein SS50377_26717 [Spironucleus salmonicida]|uniref:Uncharacterized protein n=1 Tax=Spironucleus salmonicida TaxID=348837 RepID=A0A9P8RV58_9EUKA|nr:hypothetical protein SS50377_26717 [Spironucleus salmonicida]